MVKYLFYLFAARHILPQHLLHTMCNIEYFALKSKGSRQNITQFVYFDYHPRRKTAILAEFRHFSEEIAPYVEISIILARFYVEKTIIFPTSLSPPLFPPGD